MVRFPPEQDGSEARPLTNRATSSADETPSRAELFQGFAACSDDHQADCRVDGQRRGEQEAAACEARWRRLGRWWLRLESGEIRGDIRETFTRVGCGQFVPADVFFSKEAQL